MRVVISDLPPEFPDEVDEPARPKSGRVTSTSLDEDDQQSSK